MPIVAPQDRAYPDEIRLSVDATNLGRRIIRVHESLSGIDPTTVLLYPQWRPGTHAPEGPIDRLAGMWISANGANITWTRDPADMCAFHLQATTDVTSIDIDFTHLSPTRSKVGDMEVTDEIVRLEWNTVVLYPAGYFARQIPVAAQIRLGRTGSGGQARGKRSAVSSPRCWPDFAAKQDGAHSEYTPGRKNPPWRVQNG